MAINIEQDIALLKEWIATVESFVEEHPSPVAGLTEHETLTNIILSQSRDYGPSPVTGGKLSKIAAATAQQEAGLILEYAQKYGLDPAFVFAGISGESCGDPNAINPNHQDGKPGETVLEAFMHCDIGLAQFDGATLIQADGIFADLKGLTIEEIKTKALDMEWAIDHFCAFVAKLLTDTQSEVAADPGLLRETPGGEIKILATEAYNAGPTGTEHLAHTKGTAGDWSYGSAWYTRYMTYALVMKGQT